MLICKITKIVSINEIVVPIHFFIFLNKELDKLLLILETFKIESLMYFVNIINWTSFFFNYNNINNKLLMFINDEIKLWKIRINLLICGFRVMK